MAAHDIRPSISQSRFPSRSYERMRFTAEVTISVRPSCSHTYGLAQLDTSSRAVRHSSAPVRLSRAAIHDSSSLSYTMITMSP